MASQVFSFLVLTELIIFAVILLIAYLFMSNKRFNDKPLQDTFGSTNLDIKHDSSSKIQWYTRKVTQYLKLL